MQSIKVTGTTQDILYDSFQVSHLQSDTTIENDVNTIMNILRLRISEAKQAPVMIWDEGTWDEDYWE